MISGKMIAVAGLVLTLALVASAQMNDGREGGPPPTMVMGPQPQPFGGPGPMPPMRMRELADQLRARAREAQELSDRLRRQADELDQMAKRLMDRGPGPQQQGRLQPVPPGPRMEEREEIKRQIERLRDEARRAKEQGRREDSERLWKESDRLEQVLREQGTREGGEFRGPMPAEVQDILRAAEQAEREGHTDEARRQREKADMVARQLQEQGQNRSGQPGPRGDEREAMKRKIEALRNEAQKVKDQGRPEDADRLGRDADRLEQQLREQGSRKGDELGRPGPRGDERPEMKRKIGELRNEAQKAKDQGRGEDADRLWKEADRLEQQLRDQGQKGQSPDAPDRSFKDEIVRSMGELKKEIGRLWQAVNEMRNRPREDR